MKQIGLWALAVWSLACVAWAAPEVSDDPFYPQITFADSTVLAEFRLRSPGQHLYVDMFACSLGTPEVKASTAKDETGREYYAGNALFTWQASAGTTFTLDYQGCDEAQCYMPQSRTFTIRADGSVVEGKAETVAEPKPEWRSASGFLEPEAFVAFLRGEEVEAGSALGATAGFLSDPKGWVEEHGVWLLLGVVFLGGLALNLTPCVLPMMPINLAIIGAGAVGASRWRGALRGGAYGLGIAVAYGVLALIPVLTGAAFGAIQSAWWFNALIAVVFVLLALALFDVFLIDFTRFAGAGSGKQGTVAAFVAGAISAVLAGACVAPVLLAVLLLTADFWAAGFTSALCLPFVLGLGMASPWPIAGAGLACLPKPGAWMLWVKKLFGVVILCFAVGYGWTAFKALRPAEGLDGTNLPSIQEAIRAATSEGKPVLLDFWGTACKACDEMDAKTFPAKAVQAELERFAVLKVRMDLADKAIGETQRFFGIKGLPTYVVIDP